MDRLLLDPGSLFFPDHDVLYVINRRGTFELRAGSVGLVHQRLRPHLDGRFSEADLLGAVPPERAAPLHSYLTRLREAGALLEVPEPKAHLAEPEAPAEADAPLVPASGDRFSLAMQGRQAFVSLGGFEEQALRDHAFGLFFVTPREAVHLLLEAHRWQAHDAAVSLVMAEPAGEEADTALRRAYAGWLLRHEQAVRQGAVRLSLYHLDPRAGTCTQLLAQPQVDPDAFGQLGLIRLTDLEQLPLASATVGFPLVSARVAGYGVHPDQLYDDLLRAFVAQRWAEQHGHPGLDGLAVGASQAAVQLRLLEQHAYRAAGADTLEDGQQIDVMQHASEHPDVHDLTAQLRLRRGQVPATCWTTEEGLYVFEAGAHRAYSFFHDKALADLLLALVADVFYGGALWALQPRPPADACAYAPYADEAALEAAVEAHRRTLAAQHGPVAWQCEEAAYWGLSAWIGRLT